MTQPVLPGQLISSLLFNQVLTRLTNVENALAILQTTAAAATGPTITSISGLTSPIHIGDPININGANLTSSQGETSVSFNGVPVTSFLNPVTAALIQVRVPQLSVPATGGPVSVLVGNGVGLASQQITVFPAVVPVTTDQINLSWTSVSPSTIQAGNTLLIGFSLSSSAAQTETFLISAGFTTAGWPTTYNVLDQNQNLVSKNQIVLNSGASTTFYIQVTVPSSPGPSVTVNVTASVGSVTSGLPPFSIPIGSSVPLPDTSITLTFANSAGTYTSGGVLVTSPPFATWDGTSTVAVPSGDTGVLNLTAAFSNQSNLNYTYELSSAGTVNWTTVPPLNTVTALPALTASSFTGTPPTAQQSIALHFTPQSASAGTATVTLTVKAANATSGQSRTLTLQVA
jgi:hypothetical protein